MVNRIRARISRGSGPICRVCAAEVCERVGEMCERGCENAVDTVHAKEDKYASPGNKF